MNALHKDFDPDALRAQFTMIGIGYSAPSPTNPRKDFPEKEMAELTESIKRHGVLQPIIVRMWPLAYPQPSPLTTYEVVAGERRWRAAVRAGLKMIPGNIQELTDLEVLEIQIIENLQRQDLHPLDEAEGYERIMATHAYTVEQLGEKIGKSRSYMFARLKLLALDEDARRLFRGGLLNPSTALLVARIPTTALRTKAIKDITGPHYGGEPMSVRQAQRHIQDRYMLKLDKAPFPLGDESLIPGAGRCYSCLKRTGNQPDIFDDVKSADVCTDPDCYKEKKLAHHEREVEKVISAGGTVICGAKADKIAPNGTEKWAQLTDHTRLSDTCPADPEKRTYAEILGDSVEALVLDDKEKQKLVAVVPNAVLAEKLTAAGIQTNMGKIIDADAKKAAELALERAYRDRLLTRIRDEVGDQTRGGAVQLSDSVQLALLRRVCLRLFERTGDNDVMRKIISLWEPAGKNFTERKEAFTQNIGAMDIAECWRLIVDLMVAGGSICSDWSMQYEPKSLIEVAGLFSIDAAEVKKSVVNEHKPKGVKPAKKVKSTAKTPSPLPPAEPPPSTEAAQAGELTAPAGAESKTEAAQAGGLSTDEGETLPAGAGVIERVEKTVEADDSTFSVGQAVRVKNNVYGAGGHLRKCCGREGKIEAVSGAFYTVRFGPKKTEVIADLVWNELDAMPLASVGQEPSSASGDANEKTVVPDVAGAISALKIGDCVKVRETSKNWRMAGSEAIIKVVVRAGIYQAKYGPNSCDISALDDREIAKVFPAGHVPAWLKKEPASAPAFAFEERVRVLQDVMRDGVRHPDCGREGEVDLITDDGRVEVFFDGQALESAPNYFLPSEIEAISENAGRCDKTVDMFQE